MSSHSIYTFTCSITFINAKTVCFKRTCVKYGNAKGPSYSKFGFTFNNDNLYHNIFNI